MTEPAGKDTVPLIELREVEAWRGNTCVFEALNLRIAQDQHVAVLGPNGAGKSTLLKLLAREIHPRPKPGSRLAILGETRFETRRYQARLGLVSHDLQLGFPPAATVREAVLSGFSVSLGVSGVPYRFSDMEQEQTSARLDQVGMAGLADRPYGALSTGQQRRCLLARALVTGAGHLVLDEPLAGLDPGAAYRLLALLGELMDGGVHIVLATHHVHEILPQVEHVVLLQDGAVVGAGQRRKWLTDQTISELYGLKLRLVTAGDYQFALPA